MKAILTTVIGLILSMSCLEATQATTAKTSLLEEDAFTRVVEVTSGNFDALMNFTKPVIIDVYSNRCTYCRRLEPIIADLNKELSSKYQFAKLSLDKEPALVDSFNVRGFPTIIFLKKGKELGRHVGFMNKQTFESEIQKYFGSSSK